VVIVIPVVQLVVDIWHVTKTFILHNTHQKIIAKVYSFTLRSKLTDKQ